MNQMQQEKNPTLAAILSFLINGLGQVYNGQVGKGLFIIGVQIINWLLTSIIIGFITGPIVFIWSVYDAYAVANRINASNMQQVMANTKKCPRCAERVNIDAKVCRHCSHEFVAA
ncbi:MAG: zinc ribbon domain-containing protein [Chloroflexota bacterium]